MRKSDVAPLLHACLVPALGHPHVHAMLPPPAPRAPVWTGIGHLISEAERAIGDLKAYMVAWEYPDMVTRSLARREAVSSSQIEGTRTTLPQLLDYEATQAPGTAPPDAPTTERYVVALDAGLAAVRTGGRAALSAELVQRLHATLMVFEPNCQPGQYRDEQVFIGAGRIEDATFVPCPPDAIAPAMLELERDVLQYAPGEEDTFALPLIVQVAIAHAQFETIHPFHDGNGRTGRALFHSMLRRGGLTRNVTVPVSAGLLSDTERYFHALGRYRQGDADAIVLAFADAVFAGINNGRTLVAELQEVSAHWESVVPSRRGSAGASLRTFLLQQPVVTVQMLADELGVSLVSASTAIGRYVDAGVLVQTNNFKRNRIWHSPDVLAALDRSGARARRRRL